MGPGRLETPMQIGSRMCPKDTKVSNIQTLREMGVDGRESRVVQCDLAFPWGMEEFLFKALGAKHPLQEAPNLPDHTRRRVADLLSMESQACLDRAKAQLEHWKQWGAKHARQEAKVHDQLKKVFPNVSGIVEGKNLMAFKEMLKSLNHLDTSVADLMTQGFPLVGVMEQTGVFEARQPRDVVFGADPKLLYINQTSP